MADVTLWNRAVIVAALAALPAADMAPSYSMPGFAVGSRLAPSIMLCPSSDGTNTMVACPGLFASGGVDDSTDEPMFAFNLQAFMVQTPDSFYVENQSNVVIGVQYCTGSLLAPVNCSLELLQPTGTAGRHDTADVMRWFVGYVAVQANSTGLQVMIRH